MLPLLKFIADEKEHTNQEIYDYVANFFKLTETEKAKRLAISGKIHYHNLVRWSIIYLKNAGLLQHSKRAIVRITPRGLNVLHKNPKTIDGKYLLQFPEYRIFKGVPSLKSQNALEDGDSIGGDTPDDLLEKGYNKYKKARMMELLDKVINCSPVFFERLIIRLLLNMGYGEGRLEAGILTDKSRDGGIDGQINEDPLGLDKISFQAKRYNKNSSVGSPKIRDFIGSLDTKGLVKGVFITTSSFTTEAYEEVAKNQQKK